MCKYESFPKIGKKSPAVDNFAIYLCARSFGLFVRLRDLCTISSRSKQYLSKIFRFSYQARKSQRFHEKKFNLCDFLEFSSTLWHITCHRFAGPLCFLSNIFSENWLKWRSAFRDPHFQTRRVNAAIYILLHPNIINRDSGIEIPDARLSTIKKHNSSRTVRRGNLIRGCTNHCCGIPANHS